MEGKSETVIYNFLFDGASVAEDPEDFISTLEKILQLCDMWIDRITSLLDPKSQAKQEGSFQINPTVFYP